MVTCPCPSCRNVGPEHEDEQSRRNTSPASRSKPDGRTNEQFWADVARSPINRKESHDTHR